MAGGRIPTTRIMRMKMTPQTYIEYVKRKEIFDPILSFQLANDFDVKRILKDYLPEDKESHGFATLLEWNNLYYDPERRR